MTYLRLDGSVAAGSRHGIVNRQVLKSNPIITTFRVLNNTNTQLNLSCNGQYFVHPNISAGMSGLGQNKWWGGHKLKLFNTHPKFKQVMLSAPTLIEVH